MELGLTLQIRLLNRGCASSAQGPLGFGGQPILVGKEQTNPPTLSTPPAHFNENKSHVSREPI